MHPFHAKNPRSDHDCNNLIKNKFQNLQDIYINNQKIDKKQELTCSFLGFDTKEQHKPDQIGFENDLKF